MAILSTFLNELQSAAVPLKYCLPSNESHRQRAFGDALGVSMKRVVDCSSDLVPAEAVVMAEVVKVTVDIDVADTDDVVVDEADTEVVDVR